jgi:YHS domain-containing protein
MLKRVNPISKKKVKETDTSTITRIRRVYTLDIIRPISRYYFVSKNNIRKLGCQPAKVGFFFEKEVSVPAGVRGTVGGVD